MTLTRLNRCVMALGFIFIFAFAGCSYGDSEDPQTGDAVAVDSDAVADGDASVADGVADGTQMDKDAVVDDGEVSQEDAAVDAGSDADGTSGPTTLGTWEQIQPQGVTKEHVFKGVWMSDPDDIHVVGADGIIVHYDGTDWDILTQGQWPNLNGVWGSGPDDVWAVGIGGQILHFDGASWQEPGGCTSDDHCDDGDACTAEYCGADGGCQFTAVAGNAGCCGGIHYDTNFDNGEISSWVVEDLYKSTPGQGGLTWHAVSYVGLNGMPRYTSPMHSLYFGDANAACPTNPSEKCPNFDNGVVVGATATGPSVLLPKSPKVTLSFQAWIDKENFKNVDRFSVNVISGGSVFPAWNATTVHSYFKLYQVDLTQWAGKSVQLQFAFNSIDAMDNDGEGIYVDDISISSTCGPLEGDGLSLPTLFDVWGSDADNVYAVGLNGTVARYDGTTWKKEDLNGGLDGWPLTDIHGFGDTLVASGLVGLVLGFDDGVLEVQPTPVSQDLRGIWGNGPGELFSVGKKGTILRYNGTEWKTETVGTTEDLWDVWGAGSFEVVAVGAKGTILRRVEDLWQPEVSGTTSDLFGVWAWGSKDVWAVGGEGTIVHNTGSGWDSVPSGVNDSLIGITGSASDDIWAVGVNGKILRYDGAAWSDVSSPVTQDWYSVYAGGDGTAIVAGDKGLIIIGDGEKWSEMDNPFAPYPVVSLWGSGPDDVYAAGFGYVIHYDGNEEKTWKVYATSVAPVTWRGICGSGSDNILVVGQWGTVVRYNGKNWSVVPVQPDPNPDPEEPPTPITDLLYGCWSPSPDQAWAVGENGTILELSGDKFIRGQTDYPISLRKVFGVTTDLIFAIGIEGIILYSFGPQVPWTALYSGQVAGLFDIFGTSLEDLFVVGDLGSILNFQPSALLTAEDTE